MAAVRVGTRCSNFEGVCDVLEELLSASCMMSHSAFATTIRPAKRSQPNADKLAIKTLIAISVLTFPGRGVFAHLPG